MINWCLFFSAFCSSRQIDAERKGTVISAIITKIAAVPFPPIDLHRHASAPFCRGSRRRTFFTADPSLRLARSPSFRTLRSSKPRSVSICEEVDHLQNGLPDFFRMVLQGHSAGFSLKLFFFFFPLLTMLFNDTTHLYTFDRLRCTMRGSTPLVSRFLVPGPEGLNQGIPPFFPPRKSPPNLRTPYVFARRTDRHPLQEEILVAFRSWGTFPPPSPRFNPINTPFCAGPLLFFSTYSFLGEVWNAPFFFFFWCFPPLSPPSRLPVFNPRSISRSFETRPGSICEWGSTI